MGDGGVLPVLGGFGTGSPTGAQRLPALLPGAQPALLYHPGRAVRADGHCLQLPAQLHHGTVLCLTVPGCVVMRCSMLMSSGLAVSPNAQIIRVSQ